MPRLVDEVDVVRRASVLGVVIGLGMRTIADGVGVRMRTARVHCSTGGVAPS